MGAFRYCVHCDAPLGKPDALEDLIESQLCGSCSKPQPPISSLEEWVVEAFDEIKALKRELTKIRNRGFTKLDKRIQRLVKQNRSLKKEITELKIKLEKEYVI